MVLIYIIQVYVISPDFERWEENVPFEQIINLVRSIYLSQRLEVIQLVSGEEVVSPEA